MRKTHKKQKDGTKSIVSVAINLEGSKEDQRYDHREGGIEKVPGEDSGPET